MASGAGRAIFDDVPETLDPAGRYLFHMHGRAVETRGPGARTSEGTYRQAGSCAAYFADAPGLTFEEAVLHGRLGHGLFYAPNPVWLDPVADWGRVR